MFTIEQIKEAHSKVKSGADFPAYIRALKALGVKRYDTFVTDGITEYSGENNFSVKGPARYPAMQIASTPSASELNNALRIHQTGGTDFPTFCKQAASCGVEKWRVDLNKMTCEYFDREEMVMVSEEIPGA